MAITLGRLEADFEHLRERHTEQIERLEELVRDLILTAESLRRATMARLDRSDDCCAFSPWRPRAACRGRVPSAPP
jgi:hypothetical protein